MQSVRIRPVQSTDRGAVLAITRELVIAGDTYTYTYAPDMSDDALWAYWTPTGAMDAVSSHPGVVVFASRTGSGPVRLDSRAQRAGVIATDLEGLKARVVLMAGLSSGLEHGALAALLGSG